MAGNNNDLEYGNENQIADAQILSIRQTLGLDTGFGFYEDSAVTSVSPLVVNNSRGQMTIDGLGPLHNVSQLPPSVTSFFTGNRIQGQEEGTLLNIRVGFTARGTKNAVFDLKLDISPTLDGSSTISLETILLPKTANTPTEIKKEYQVFVGATFAANGAAVFFDTTSEGVNVSFYDFELLISREHKPLNVS